MPYKGYQEIYFWSVVRANKVIGITEQLLIVTRQERRLWVGCLFLGCSMIYATRTVMPLCAVAISEQLQWDKTQSVIT